MDKMKMMLLITAGVIFTAIAIVFGVQGVQNKAIVLEEQINVANSDIKVQEKRRVDLIYNLVDCVKEYDKHEYNTLKDVVDARSSNGGNIDDVSTLIAATAESYPELKSSDNYKQLMKELSMTENMIAEHRSNFNKQVKHYKRYVRKFPNNIFLNMLGYEQVEYTYLDYNAPVDAPKNLFDGKQ